MHTQGTFCHTTFFCSQVPFLALSPLLFFLYFFCPSVHGLLCAPMRLCVLGIPIFLLFFFDTFFACSLFFFFSFFFCGSFSSTVCIGAPGASRAGAPGAVESNATPLAAVFFSFLFSFDYCVDRGLLRFWWAAWSHRGLSCFLFLVLSSHAQTTLPSCLRSRPPRTHPSFSLFLLLGSVALATTTTRSCGARAAIPCASPTLTDLLLGPPFPFPLRHY